MLIGRQRIQISCLSPGDWANNICSLTVQHGTNNYQKLISICCLPLWKKCVVKRLEETETEDKHSKKVKKYLQSTQKPDSECFFLLWMTDTLLTDDDD